MATDSVLSVQIRSFNAGVVTKHDDLVAAEQALEIRVDHELITVTMRTPGHDFELAAGFLHAEGIIASSADLHALERSHESLEPENTVIVKLRPDLMPNLSRIKRLHLTSSACGACGSDQLEALRARLKPITSNAYVKPELILSLSDQLRKNQRLFETTGGVHAAGLFNTDGQLLIVHEDIGRHNTVDKLVGHALLVGIELEQTMMLVSGRAGFEIVQKCIAARISILCAVGAPSSLAVELANAFGLTLVGFLRENRFNTYSHATRVLG